MYKSDNYYIYMMGSANGRALYIGVTSDLQRRVLQHKEGRYGGFTTKYRCHHLLYYERFYDINQAIAREKQLKGWIRAKKEELIKSINPDRIDLSLGWYEPVQGDLLP